MRSTMNANQYLGVKFRAMNTEMAAIGRKEEGPLPYWQRPVIGMFSAVEQAASRFRVDSGLTHLNHASVGEPVPVALILLELLQRSWQLAAATDYLFQPYIGNVMKRMGYDRSFELLEYTKGNKCDAAASTDLNLVDIPTPSKDMDQVSDPNALTFDGKLQTVTRHVDRELDLGGIGKGWTADRASALMRGTFEVDAGLVDAGGDLVVWTEGDPWCIGIQDPEDEEKEVLQLWVKKAGIATSNVRHRRWIYDNREFHHIVNGRTGLPAASDVIQATVLAPRVDEAEVAAKILCMLGSKEGPAWMSSRFPQNGYILIKKSGETLVNREVSKYAIKVV